jgi:hypothetical protein
MEKKRIILPPKKFFGSPDEDLNIRLGLDESQNLLREGDRTIILDNSILFAKERNESPNYKIHGKLKMVFRNMYSGETNYDTLRERLYLVGDGTEAPPGYSGSFFVGFLPYDEFAFLRKDVYREVNLITSGTSELDFYTPNIQLTGTNPHQSISSIEAPYHNWNIYLSYIYSGDTQFPIKYTLSGNTVYSFLSGDGIPFRVTDNGSTYTLICPVEHGISDGEYITISGGTLDNTVPVSGRTFLVVSVGDSTYNSEKYVLDINKSEIPSGTTLSTVILGKRCINKNSITATTSTYYVHKHKTLTQEKDYILDKVGFESPIWENEKKLLLENSAGVNDYLVERNRMESLIYDFKNAFALSGLTNNLGYLPTEVYVTVVFINGNGYFDYPPKVGFKFNFHNSWIDEQFDGSSSIETTIPTTTFTRTVSGGTFTFTGGTELPLGTILNGAFIEYNKSELKERVISETFHKFSNPTNVFDYHQTDSNYYSGATSTNKTGLFYQPHYRIKLRQLSPYVETSNTSEVYGLPQNAKYFEDEKLWKWHDLYDHGFIDPDGFGTNFPFMNNIHYVKNDINFYLRNERMYENKNNGIKKINKFNC